MHLSGIFLHLLVHFTISSIFQQYQHLQSMSGIVKNFLACSILSFLHFLACSIIFKHFLACLAFSNISSSSIFLGLAASGKDKQSQFAHFETLKPKCSWVDGTGIFDHLDYRITFILLISCFSIKGRYHYGAGVDTDKREDQQKEKENIRGEERKKIIILFS